MSEMKEIDIEKIMQEIREEIKEKKMQETGVDFASVEGTGGKEVFNHAAFRECLHHVNNEWNISFYTEVGTGIKALLKKVIRKMLVFIGVPLTEQQRNFNAHMVQTLNEMEHYICTQEEKQKELLEIIEDLEARIYELKKNA